MDNIRTTDSEIERDAIRNVQKYLRHLSFHSSEINDLPVDGIWDSATKEALKVFQREEGLYESGIVDRETWDLLKQRYDESVAMNSPPAYLALFPRFPIGFEIKPGDRGYLVVTVQHLLRELERLYFFPDLPSDISGEYDEQTESAVKEFQRRNHIAVTGRVGRETWDAMAVQNNILLNYSE
jgi:peptidoglycan hydrolase-like protein with peptidoglycan-binding domain